jgi:DNA polymerase III alpha subunit
MNNYIVESNEVVFDCGCRIPIVDGKIYFVADAHSKDFNVDFNCSKTWSDLSQGLCCGVFQLQSPLGTQWCKKLSPSQLEHMAALGAILRPSCLQSKDEKGDSITVRYERKKNGKMENTSYHPVIDKILSNTYGENIYQESSLEIVKQCAGFTLVEADLLRRGLGKKLPEVIAKIKKNFLIKAKEVGILTDEQAIEVFGWIESGQRYQFNASHSYSYAINGYITAYIKSHFPVQFYKNWLKNEKKRDRYKNYVNEAKLYNIFILPPDLRHLKNEFYYIGNNIYFGLNNIKGVVTRDLEKLSTLLSDEKTEWTKFIAEVLDNISKDTVYGLIHSGALDFYQLDRAVMWDDYVKFRMLTPKEKKIDGKTILEKCEAALCEYKKTFEKNKLAYDVKTKKRIDKPRKKTPKPLKEPKLNERADAVLKLIKLIREPVYNIEDTIDSIIFNEEDLLGVALTRHESESIRNCLETHSCLDIANGCKESVVLKVKIERASAWAVKSGENAGQEMCYLIVSDNSCRLDNVRAYTKVYAEYKYLLVKNNLVFIRGEIDKDQFIVKKVYSV